MADTRAFTQLINPNGTISPGEHGAISQSSPSWVLTFVRWQSKDTLRLYGTTAINPNASNVLNSDPLVVENDCVQVSVSVNKGSLTPTVNATLLMTDTNYLTAVQPGDFMFVNMLNWPTDIQVSTTSNAGAKTTVTIPGSRTVANNARAHKPINGQYDGFKGVFKVQSVRRTDSTDSVSGTRGVVFSISGFAFTEFNNTIYFNPYLLNATDQSNQLLFASYLGSDWANLVNLKGLNNVQDIITILIQSLIGNGITADGSTVKGSIVKTPNVHFLIPPLVGTLLNIKNATAAKDMFIYLFGLQNYNPGSMQTLQNGMSPSGMVEKYNNVFYTPVPNGGNSLLKPEYWNQVKTWSILNQYTNAPLNELYTSFRISQAGNVMPTVVFRQIPFTNEDFVVRYSTYGALPVTRFMNLPRWKISPAMIFDYDIGRDEAARINFVQYYGKSTISSGGAAISTETAQKNYTYDINDVQRSGLRPYIVTTQFDESTSVDKGYASPGWAAILGDALIDGNLKLNGTVNCIGITDPIAVGDNLELDGVVYHIEQITHLCVENTQNGEKSFRTSISISNGVSINSTTQAEAYPEMTNTSAYALRIADFNNNQILPGVSDSQTTLGRTTPDTPTKGELTNNPFIQPAGVKIPTGTNSDGGASN